MFTLSKRHSSEHALDNHTKYMISWWLWQLLAGIGLALWHRDKCGKGQLVDASLLRSGLPPCQCVRARPLLALAAVLPGIWAMAYPLVNTALNPGGELSAYCKQHSIEF